MSKMIFITACGRSMSFLLCRLKNDHYCMDLTDVVYEYSINIFGLVILCAVH